jgi:outer membrane protein assembly factor BamB
MTGSSALAADAVGWRTDWTGKYPSADPPLKWSPTENVVWKTPMPAWGNATPVLVGDKLLVCAEPATLLCLDAKTGAILWQQTATYYDTVPPDEAARLKKLADEINLAKTQRELSEARGKLNRLQAELGDRTATIAKLKRDAEKQKDNAELQQKFADEIAKIEAELPDVQKKLEAERPALAAAVAELEKKIEPVKMLVPPATHGANGFTSPTPVSDGKNVYVFFTTGVVACFNLAGERQWTVMTEKFTLTYGVSASPLLVDGKVIVHPLDVHALDAATGKAAWRQRVPPLWGSPALTEIEGQKVIITNSGDWLLAATGEKVATRTGKASYNQPLVAGGVVYFIENGGSAWRLPAKVGDKPEKLWTTNPPSPRYYASPVLHEGILYDINEQGLLVAIDAANGQLIYQQKLDLGREQCYPSVTLAGKYLFASGSDGITVAFEPGRTFKEAARNKLEQFRATPIFSGTRMYVRTMKNVYCLGK